MVIAGGGDGDAQQILIVVDRLDHGAEEQQELRVLTRRLTGLEQVDARVGRDGPVVVLAGAVDAREGLFVQQADHTVLAGDLLHELHGELVVVSGDVGGGEDGRELMLRGRDLVVLRLGEHTELPQLLVQIVHERGNARLDGAEVMILQLLPLGRLRAEQGPAGIDEVLALAVKRLVDEEVLLLRADRRADGLDLVMPEQLQDTQALLVDGLHRAQQRRLFVERLAAVGTERGRDIQDLILDEREGRRVPRGIASGLERGAQTAGGEAGRVRLALDELLAGKFHDHAAVGGGRDERVVLFGRDAGHGLEPVGEVRRAELDSPVLHGIGDDVGCGQIEALALVDGGVDIFKNSLRKLLLHHGFAEHMAAKEIRYSLHKKLLTF